MMKGFRNSIRNKILFGFILLVLTTCGSSLFIGYKTMYKGIMDQAYETVRSDLNTAEYLFYNRLYQNRAAVGYMATLEYIQDAIIRKDRLFLYKKFMELKNYLGVDIIIITDPQGIVIQRINNRELKGDNVINIDTIRQAIAARKQVSGTGCII